MYRTKVKDLMTREIVSVSIEDSIEKVAQLMVETQIGSVLVHEDYKPIGIITKRDILERVVLDCHDPCKVKAKDIATKNLITMNSGETVRDALMLMFKHKIKRVLIEKPDNRKLVGIITTHDLIAAFNVLEHQS